MQAIPCNQIFFGFTQVKDPSVVGEALNDVPDHREDGEEEQEQGLVDFAEAE